MAVQILQESGKQNTGLRKWAVSLIDEYSDVKLAPEVAKQLETGEVTWPSSMTIERLLSELRGKVKEGDRQRRASIAGITLPRDQFKGLVSLLSELLSHEDEAVRSTAFSCLQAIGTPEAIKVLEEHNQ
jgi:HEAT repeat protein